MRALPALRVPAPADHVSAAHDAFQDRTYAALLMLQDFQMRNSIASYFCVPVQCQYPLFRRHGTFARSVAPSRR